MFRNLGEWLKNHSHAILATVVALQNSGAFSAKVKSTLSLLAFLLGGGN